jgi:hypothetical protein
MAEIPELGVAPKSIGTRSGSLWLMAAKTRSLEVVISYLLICFEFRVSGSGLN